MGDRERGVVLAALGVGLLVVSAADFDPGSWSSRVELGLGVLGVLVGVALVVRDRRR